MSICCYRKYRCIVSYCNCSLRKLDQEVAIDISRVQRNMMNDKPKQPVVMATVRVDTQGVEYPAPETH